MDEPYGRLFAVVYFVAWPALVAGVASASATDGAIWALAIAFVSAAALVVLANILSRRSGDERRRHWYSMSGYQRAWYELVLGVEARRAWQILWHRTG